MAIGSLHCIVCSEDGDVYTCIYNKNYQDAIYDQLAPSLEEIPDETQ